MKGLIEMESLNVLVLNTGATKSESSPKTIEGQNFDNMRYHEPAEQSNPV